MLDAQSNWVYSNTSTQCIIYTLINITYIDSHHLLKKYLLTSIMNLNKGHVKKEDALLLEN